MEDRESTVIYLLLLLRSIDLTVIRGDIAEADIKGGLAQLARAPALQAGGQRFESVILHSIKEPRTLTYWKRDDI